LIVLLKVINFARRITIMANIAQIELLTQKRIITIFKNELSYEYLGKWDKRENNQPIEDELLKAYLLQRGYCESLIKKALYELHNVADDQIKSLYEINKEVYSFLRYGVKVLPEHGQNNVTIKLIDWGNPQNNHFAIAEEVTVKGQSDKRPDIVLYVNGIAIAVLELKRSIVSVSEGIRQNLDNQKKDFIQSFFSTIQLVMAGNDSEGLRYGVIQTPEKYYLKWKERGETDCSLDSHLAAICNKDKLLELIHDFIVFDGGIKKICRHNQYNAVKASQVSIREREGGIIWHTQGSGKSLIMVWLAEWIREHVTDSRVLIITDRDELDKQIERVFWGVSEEIYRTKSSADLIDKLNDTEEWLICSLIHKFRNSDEDDYTELFDVIRKIPPDFKAKGDIYVFVDECHRTQSGEFHRVMRSILPNALFIGFTGTPLLKQDKQTSLEVFGKFIDTYKFDEAVFDKAIVDLRYQAKDIDQEISSPEKIDAWFEAKTKGLTPLAKATLKRKWGTMQTVLSCRTRLGKIVADILFDMNTQPRLANGRGNAILIAGSIYEAYKFYNLFIQNNFNKCAVVTSYAPNINDIKGETIGDDEVSEMVSKYETAKAMFDGKTREKFDDEMKKKFVKEPGQMKLLIVVDMLLTGFDAPSATYLYIDKQMQDHGLFQAICRVNRIDTDDKEYGYIVDYKDLFQSLEQAVKDYTSEAFDKYDKADVQGLLTDRLTKAKQHLIDVLESMKALCEPVLPPKEELDYIHYFCGNTDNEDDLKDNEQKRLTLYKTTASLLRAYAEIANEMSEAGFTEAETKQIIKDVEFYENVRSVIKLASKDYIDLKQYEPAMRYLIDTYIEAKDSKVISAFDDLGLIDLIVQRGVGAIEELPDSIKNNEGAVAETIENNVRKLIIDEMPTNPKYYEKMSLLLDELIKARKEAALAYQEYLKRIVELTKLSKQPDTSKHYPISLNSQAKRALFDNLNEDEELALKLHKEIMLKKNDDWRGHLVKERIVKNIIKPYINDKEELDRIFELVKNQQEY
jgi:type I restriction enzyme, R subunit